MVSAAEDYRATLAFIGSRELNRTVVHVNAGARSYKVKPEEASVQPAADLVK
jgi:hypothetical protein